MDFSESYICKFVKTWQKSTCLMNFCQRMKIQSEKARKIAGWLRNRGVRIKKMPTREPLRGKRLQAIKELAIQLSPEPDRNDVRFVEVWNTSESKQEVYLTLGRSIGSVNAQANRLRKSGVKLKSFLKPAGYKQSEKKVKQTGATDVRPQQTGPDELHLGRRADQADD